jgi:hypothetical protein
MFDRNTIKYGAAKRGKGVIAGMALDEFQVAFIPVDIINVPAMGTNQYSLIPDIQKILYGRFFGREFLIKRLNRHAVPPPSGDVNNIPLGCRGYPFYSDIFFCNLVHFFLLNG